MQEILPGVFHWTTFHEGIGQRVHSYFITATTPAVLIDPRAPARGLGFFLEHQPQPEHAYLTNRLHYRHSDQFAETLGVQVWCHEAGLHEFHPGQAVRGFRHGAALPGGVRALKVGSLCPEETAFKLPVAGGILAVGDAIIRHRGELGFVPDYLMGDDPEGVKRGLRRAFGRHARQQQFDHLLFAHASPWLGGARTALQDFVSRA